MWHEWDQKTAGNDATVPRDIAAAALSLLQTDSH